jgi:uncharacterized protein (TIGR00369 family)
VPPMNALMTPLDMEALFDKEFPQIHTPERVYSVIDTGYMRATMRLRYTQSALRPGGTISGPAMMALCDLALYTAILASIGPVTLAVTTNLAFNFLNKPEPRDLIAECRLLKLGKRLAVGEVTLISEGSTVPVCHATGTYSIPPR